MLRFDLGEMGQHRRLQAVFVGLGFVMAIVLGLIVPTTGIEILGWLLLPLGVLLVWTRPFLGVLLVVMVIPIENMFLVGAATATRLLGMAVYGLWLMRKLARRESWQLVFSVRYLVPAVLLLALALTSTLWAKHPSDVYTALFSLSRLLLWSLLVADLADSWDRLSWLARVLVLAGLVAAILTLGQYFTGSVSSSERAGKGLSGTSNDTAILLVTILPFAFYLVAAQGGRLWRSLGLLYIVCATAATLATLSRSGLVLLVLIILGGSLGLSKRRPNRIWIVLAAGLALLLLMPFLPLDALAERAQTIAPALRYVFGAALGGDFANMDIAARGSIFRVGLAIFRDHPLVGVGLANFGHYYLVYRHLVQSGLRTVSFKISPHSVYLAFLVELGLVGLVLWLSILWTAWQELSRARSKLSKSSDQLLLLNAVTWAFLVQVISGWVVTVQHEKLLWLLLGLGVTIQRLVTQSAPSEQTGDNTS